MAYISALEACRIDLYTSTKDLADRYPEAVVKKVLRVRTIHQMYLSDPATSDSDAVESLVSLYQISRPTAYDDLKILKTLLPSMSDMSKDFHRWRFNEMVLESFRSAKMSGNFKGMERAAATYARYNRVDEIEKTDVPVDEIVPQPFVATDDPSVLGIEPLPNIRERQRQLLDKYLSETPDIMEIDFEPADLQEDELFGDPAILRNDEENLL